MWISLLFSGKKTTYLSFKSMKWTNENDRYRIVVDVSNIINVDRGTIMVLLVLCNYPYLNEKEKDNPNAFHIDMIISTLEINDQVIPTNNYNNMNKNYNLDFIDQI